MDLQLENIRKAYGDKQVLRDCTFAFEKGKIYGLSLIHISEPTRHEQIANAVF